MKNYLLVFVILLIIEIFIAHFHFNPFIRGFVGDVLVIPLIYAFLKIFLRTKIFTTAICVLAFSFLVELLQFFRLSELLNIKSKVLLIILGSVFDPLDLAAYFIGFLIILFLENYFNKNKGLRFLNS